MSDDYLDRVKKDLDEAYNIVDRQIRELKYGEDVYKIQALHRVLGSARKNLNNHFNEASKQKTSIFDGSSP